MHRTQIYLQDELYEELKARSSASGLSISELIRRSVQKDIKAEPGADARAFFEKLTPLESFSCTDPGAFVRNLRTKSRIIGKVHEDIP